jgi:hypothetical protein
VKVPHVFRVADALLDLQSIGSPTVLSFQMRIAKKDANNNLALDVG